LQGSDSYPGNSLGAIVRGDEHNLITFVRKRSALFVKDADVEGRMDGRDLDDDGRQ
jgi:hypothetical protein